MTSEASAVLADGQQLPVRSDLPLKDGDVATIGLRPEHLKVVASGEIEARVEVVEPLGMSTQFYTQLANQQVCVFTMGRVAVGPGDTIRLSVKSSDLHVFDPASGKRMDS